MSRLGSSVRAFTPHFLGYRIAERLPVAGASKHFLSNEIAKGETLRNLLGFYWTFLHGLCWRTKSFTGNFGELAFARLVWYRGQGARQ
jgi:hypothetical protein